MTLNLKIPDHSAGPRDLTEKQAKILRMSDVEGMSLVDIGKELRMQPVAVKGSLDIARTKSGQRPEFFHPGQEKVESNLPVVPGGLTTDQFIRLREFVTDMGLLPGQADAYARRLAAANGVRFDVKDLMTDEGVKSALAHKRALALLFLDEYTLSRAGAADLVKVIGQLTEKLQLLEHKPTAILGWKDVEKMDELAEKLQAELDRRMKIVNAEPVDGSDNSST